MEKTCSSGVEVDQLLTLQPICIVEDMVTSGVSISKSRIGQFYLPTQLTHPSWVPNPYPTLTVRVSPETYFIPTLTSPKIPFSTTTL